MSTPGGRSGGLDGRRVGQGALRLVSNHSLLLLLIA